MITDFRSPGYCFTEFGRCKIPNQTNPDSEFHSKIFFHVQSGTASVVISFNLGYPKNIRVQTRG